MESLYFLICWFIDHLSEPTTVNTACSSVAYHCRIIDNLPAVFCYHVQQVPGGPPVEHCDRSFPIGCYVTDGGEPKDFCAAEVRAIVSFWIYARGWVSGCESSILLFSLTLRSIPARSSCSTTWSSASPITLQWTPSGSATCHRKQRTNTPAVSPKWRSYLAGQYPRLVESVWGLWQHGARRDIGHALLSVFQHLSHKARILWREEQELFQERWHDSRCHVLLLRHLGGMGHT